MWNIALIEAQEISCLDSAFGFDQMHLLIAFLKRFKAYKIRSASSIPPEKDQPRPTSG